MTGSARRGWWDYRTRGELPRPPGTAIRPAAERTGLCAYSLHFPLAHGLAVYTLDGRERIEDPVIPPSAHPGIVASGEGS